MIKICKSEKCTGCGMCSNICPKGAISMKPGEHGFVFPQIDQEKCIDCGLCEKKCPANNPIQGGNVRGVYAAWNKNSSARNAESSGGVFSALAAEMLNIGGIVFGVAWSKEYLPEHIKVDSIKELPKLFGSKYAQSDTGIVYKQARECLESGKSVLFSGTPCQVAGLRSFLGKAYSHLLTVDVVCHGVPSATMLDRYYDELGVKQKLSSVNLRHKDPYWDYEYVTMKCGKETVHHELTIKDAYYNLFNIGYSLRESCHDCQYANISRVSDITLADFWGYRAHSLKTVSYNKGTSCIIVNSEKGSEFIDKIKNAIFIEERTIDEAIRGNKCLKESFKLDEKKAAAFWEDFDSKMTVVNLDKKYSANTFNLPSHIRLRRLLSKWKWIIGR